MSIEDEGFYHTLLENTPEWSKKRLQVDLIIFALEGGPWYGHNHTSFIGKMNHHSQNFPLYGEPKNLADPHLLSSLEGLKNLWLLYSENTWDGNMIIYISSFNYRTTTRRVSKTKDIKLLEENLEEGVHTSCSKCKRTSPCRHPKIAARRFMMTMP